MGCRRELGLVGCKLAPEHCKRGLEDYMMGLEDYRRAQEHCMMGLVMVELGHCSLVQGHYRKVQVLCRQELELDYKKVELEEDYKRPEGWAYK